MKVKELKNFLENLGSDRDDDEVVMSSGEDYSPLDAMDSEAYIYESETTWCGNIDTIRFDESERDEDEDEWAEYCKDKRCLVLWPVN